MNRQLIEEFLSFLQTEKLCSENTVSAYRADLSQFLDLLQRFGIGAWDQVTPTVVEGFVAELRADGKKESTVARKVSAIKSFFSFLAARSVVAEVAIEAIKTPQLHKSEPKTLSAAELERLIARLREDRSNEGQRNLVIVQLLNYTGWRITNLLELDMGNVVIDQQEVLLRLPDGVERRLPDEMVDDIQVYMSRTRRSFVRGTREKALLVNRRGERLTRQGVWQIFKTIADRNGIDPDRLTPRTIRSTAAARHFAAGESTEEVQAFLRLSNPASTERYQIATAV